jgi:hypothetical protein
MHFPNPTCARPCLGNSDRFLYTGAADTASHRVEMRGIVGQDIRSRFPIPQSWLDTYNEKLKDRFITSQSEVLASLLSQHLPDTKEWISIYSDLIHFSQLTHIESVKSNGRSWLESPDVGGWTNVLILRLLDWRPMELLTGTSQVIAEMLRIGSLLYLVPVWRKYGVIPVRSDALIRKLIALWSKNLKKWEKLWLLEAWVLVMGAMESKACERQFFVQELGKLAGINSIPVSEVLRQAKNVMWIQDVFDKSELSLQDELDFYEAARSGIST